MASAYKAYFSYTVLSIFSKLLKTRKRGIFFKVRYLDYYTRSIHFNGKECELSYIEQIINIGEITYHIYKVLFYQPVDGTN